MEADSRQRWNDRTKGSVEMAVLAQKTDGLRNFTGRRSTIAMARLNVRPYLNRPHVIRYFPRHVSLWRTPDRWR
jgi:hypothetical protein